MNKSEALEKLRQLKSAEDGLEDDPEVQHLEADRVLVALIDDDEITAAYNVIVKWYA